MIKNCNLVALLQDKNVLKEDYFDTLKSIPVKEIMGLTDKELEQVSLSSIVDYFEINGLYADEKYRQWLNELYAKLHKPEFDHKIVFKGTKFDKRYYATSWRFWNKEFYLLDGFIYNYNYNGAVSVPSAEQTSKFNECFRAFIADLHKAKQGLDGFLCAKLIDKQIYFRRLPNFEYQFISIGKNNFSWQDVCSIDVFLQNCPFLVTESGKNRKIPNRVIEWVKSGDFPLMLTSDKYMHYECKYLCGCASQKEADYLAKIDNKSRFIPQKQVYGLEDIKIINATKSFTKYATGPIGLNLEAVIDGKQYSLYWAHYVKELTVCTYWHCPKLNITAELSNYFTELMQSDKITCGCRAR